MKLTPIPLLRNLATLAESPCWHPGEGALYFTDIPAGKIWRFDPASSRAEIFHEGEITGGLTLQENGDWLLFREKDLTWLDSSGGLKKTRPVHLPGAQRFNDVIADPAGRVYAGTIGLDEQLGGLYRFEPDGRHECLFQGTRISNGMAFSPCGRYFYWTCSTRSSIYRFGYDPETGELSGRSLLYQCDSAEGIPDGLTVDSRGNLWSARWGSGRVVTLSPAGEKLAEIDFPESNISSLTWGGADLEDLYVTAAREGGKPGIHDLFVIPQAGSGKLENRSRL
jgi:D-xylono/L-arabinono-1,4-lactonase